MTMTDSATDNRTTELLPCPFCGGKAALHMSWMGDGYRYRAVKCVECGATTPGNYSEVGDQSAWDWNTRATHGTLTAEQVEIAINNHCQFTVGCVVDAQAIADELNARAERTCRLDYERHCSECGVYVHESAVLVWKSLGENLRTVVPKPVNYCPNCGAKVRGE